MTTPKDEAVALLPCPFCGGAAEIVRSWVPRSVDRAPMCSDTECIGHQCEQDEQGGWTVSFSNDADAIAAWNRRAHPAGAEAPSVVLSDALGAVQAIRAFPSEAGEVEGRITVKGARSLDAFCDRILSALSAPVSDQGWQPIETAPKDGGEIIVYSQDTTGSTGLSPFVSLCAWHPDAGFCTCELRAVTHWMPLPPPPHGDPS
jgi:hypothetical protein